MIRSAPTQSDVIRVIDIISINESRGELPFPFLPDGAYRHTAATCHQRREFAT